MLRTSSAPRRGSCARMPDRARRRCGRTVRARTATRRRSLMRVGHLVGAQCEQARLLQRRLDFGAARVRLARSAVMAASSAAAPGAGLSPS